MATSEMPSAVANSCAARSASVCVTTARQQLLCHNSKTTAEAEATDYARQVEGCNAAMAFAHLRDEVRLLLRRGCAIPVLRCVEDAILGRLDVVVAMHGCRQGDSHASSTKTKQVDRAVLVPSWMCRAGCKQLHLPLKTSAPPASRCPCFWRRSSAGSSCRAPPAQSAPCTDHSPAAE